MNKISNILMATALAALLPTNYAFAATVNIEVNNTNKNSTHMSDLVAVFSLHHPGHLYQFSIKSGKQQLQIQDAVYIVLDMQALPGTITPIRCTEYPGGPGLNNIDLNGHDKSITLRLNVDETSNTASCYQVGG